MDSGSSCMTSELNSTVDDFQSDEHLQIASSRIQADFGRLFWAGVMPSLDAAQTTGYVTNSRRSHDYCWAEECA